jgi:UDP-3-O-[3-hydroxymyristoyl] N-acetylglucosamine deacetylase
MHTALVQRLMRDRSAWELAHVYDEVPEPTQAETKSADLEGNAGVLSEALPVHA